MLLNIRILSIIWCEPDTEFCKIMILINKLIIPVIALILSAGPVMAADVNIGIDKPGLKVGDLVNVSIDLAGFPTTHGGGINLKYNENVLRATGVQINPVWNFVNKNGVINNANGSVSDILFTHYNGLDGNIPAVVVQMQVIGTGSANLIASESAQNPFAGPGGTLPATINNNLAALYVQGEADPESTTAAEETTATPETVAAAADQPDGTNNAAATTDNSQAESVATNVAAVYMGSASITSDSTSSTAQQATQPGSYNAAAVQSAAGNRNSPDQDYSVTGSGVSSGVYQSDSQANAYNSDNDNIVASNVTNASMAGTVAESAYADNDNNADAPGSLNQAASGSTGLLPIISGIALVLILMLGGYLFYRKSTAR